MGYFRTEGGQRKKSKLPGTCMMPGREGWGNEGKCNLDSPRREGGEVSWGTKSNEVGI